MSEITQEDMPYVLDVPPPTEIIGGMTQPHIHFESLTRIYSPESARRGIGVIVLPGFGHHVGSLGVAFGNHAHAIASKLGIVSAIAIDDESDAKGLAFWQIPGAGKAWALRETIEELNRRSVFKHVVIGFSNSSYDAMEVAAQRSSVTGLMLVAPTSNPEKIVETLTRAGRSVIPDPADPQSLLIGQRQTLVVHDLSGDEESSAHFIKEDMRGIAQHISKRHIPTKVLWGNGDPVVPRDQAQEVATLLGTDVTVVGPMGTNLAKIHDFDSDVLRNGLIKELETML